jgi:hypothetical protein
MRRVALGLCLAVPTLAGGCFHGGAEADEETIALAKRAYERAKARGVAMS